MSEPLVLEDLSGEEPDQKKKKSPLGAIIAIVVMALIAGGAGWAVSQFVLLPQLEAKVEASKIAAEELAKMAAEADLELVKDADKLSVVPVEPIITNIADPTSIWVRAEFSLLTRGGTTSQTLAEFQNDVVAYLRTQKIQNLEGSSAFQHLIEDVTAIAKSKNPESVDRVLVRSFIIE